MQPTTTSPKWRAIVSWVLRVILGFAFLLIGATKLTSTAHAVEYFEAIGWGQWFRYLTGFLDVAGAALLFLPRCTFYGTIVLISSVGTATVLSLTVLRGDPVLGEPRHGLAAAGNHITLHSASLADVAVQASVISRERARRASRRPRKLDNGPPISPQRRSWDQPSIRSDAVPHLPVWCPDSVYPSTARRISRAWRRLLDC
jgi:putative oxidoreductase